MHQYLEYNCEDVQLIRKCARLHTRSRSQLIRSKSRSKVKLSPEFHQPLHDTMKLVKGTLLEGLDQMSTKKKEKEPLRINLIQQVSQFTISEQSQEESGIQKQSNLKIPASQRGLHSRTPAKTQKDMLQRIDELKKRLEYRLYSNYRELIKRPAYGKYITCKYEEK